MLVHCMIERVGSTPVVHKKMTYLFMPVLDPKRDPRDQSTSVADINIEELLQRLFLDKDWREHVEFSADGNAKAIDPDYWKDRQYIPYIPGQMPPSKKETVDMAGFAFRTHGNYKTAMGYMIENNNAKPKQYAGSDGAWRDNIKELISFDNQMEAYSWLKDEGIHTAKFDKEITDKKNPLLASRTPSEEADALLASFKKGKK